MIIGFDVQACGKVDSSSSCAMLTVNAVDCDVVLDIGGGFLAR